MLSLLVPFLGLGVAGGVFGYLLWQLLDDELTNATVRMSVDLPYKS